jgi:hypothetical protein
MTKETFRTDSSMIKTIEDDLNNSHSRNSELI